MILVNLAGGLGNQMFQFACGQALAATTGQQVRYLIDSLGLYAERRALELETVFGLTVPLAQPNDVLSVIGRWRSTPQMRRLLARPQASWLRGRGFVAEQNFNFISNLSDLARSGAYLHGYWQSERYFEAHSDIVRRAFRFQGDPSPANLATMERIAGGPTIAIHVRRGGFIANSKTLSVHGVLSEEYYLDAIALLRTTTRRARVFAFSDDPDWVNDKILPRIYDAEIVAHNFGHESFRDMQLMSMCDHIVIANSSFSWWAAWLNEKPDKIIVAPKKWFASAKVSSDTVVPSNWQRI